MTTANQTPPSGDGDEIGREAARGLDEIEQHLIAIEHLTATADQQVDVWPAADDDPAVYGLTDAVLDLEVEVAEGERLKALYARRIELDLDSPAVMKKRLAGQQAAKLHALGQLPAVRALQAAAAQRVITTAGLIALTLALGWSTVGVHAFAAAGAPAWSPAWVVGWFVEPFMSLALLAIVGAKSFFATRGHRVDSPTLERIEWTFLALTFGMNVYPTIPAPIGPAVKFELPALVLHSLGPIVAVAIVRALPVLWAEFARLDHGLKIADDTAAKPEYRQNVAVGTTDAPAVDAFEQRVTELTDRARYLIDHNMLDRNAKAYKIRTALGCGMDYARAVRARLDQGA